MEEIKETDPRVKNKISKRPKLSIGMSWYGDSTYQFFQKGTQKVVKQEVLARLVFGMFRQLLKVHPQATIYGINHALDEYSMQLTSKGRGVHYAIFTIFACSLVAQFNGELKTSTALLVTGGVMGSLALIISAKKVFHVREKTS